MLKKISSTANPAVKRLLQLQEKSRLRKKEGVFVVEGQREIELALKGGYEVLELFFVDELIAEEKLEKIFRRKKIPQLTALTADVYEKIAYRGSTEGIIGIIKARDTSLKHLELPQKNLLILVAEAPEKPGNIGALLRTADAAGIDVVLIANPRTDIFNPNIIRSSVGCVFTTRIATGTSGEIIEFLQRNRIEIYAAALQASKNYSEIDYTGSCAIVVGTEATGLSREWIENSSQNIIIPMQGQIDSMNVSVAAGILIFEAKRQRGFQ